MSLLKLVAVLGLLAVTYALQVPTLSQLLLQKTEARQSVASFEGEHPPGEQPDEPTSDRESAEIFSLSDVGDHEEAVTRAEKRLDTHRKLAGDHRRLVSADLFLMGLVLKAKGDLNRARSFLEESVEMRRACYGPEHLAVAQPLETLGDLAYESGDYPAAEKAYSGSLSILDESLGPGQRTTRIRRRMREMTARLAAREDPAAAPPPKKLKPSELWAIYPTPFPWEAGADGYVWRVMYDCLALGLTTVASQRCVDPSECERRPEWRRMAEGDRRPPSQEDLERFREELGLGHVLVPSVTADKTGFTLRLAAAHGPDGGPLTTPSVLAKASLPLMEPVTAAAATLQAARTALESLGARFDATTAAWPSDSTTLPPPVVLLERLQTRAKRWASAPRDSTALAALARDYSSLGKFLTSAGVSPGPRLLIRGAALAALAGFLSPDSPVTRRARAYTDLLARHSASARVVLGPLLPSGDPEARAIDAACRIDMKALDQIRGHPFIHRDAYARSHESMEGRKLVELLEQGLPLAFVLAGSKGHIPVGDAKLYTSLWVAAEEDEAFPKIDGAKQSEMKNKAVSDWGTAFLRRRADRLPKARAAAPGIALVSPELPGDRQDSIRRELLVAPAVEYAVMAMQMWGVVEEAKAMLEGAQAAVPDSRLVARRMAQFRELDSSGQLTGWHSSWESPDPADPWLAKPVQAIWNKRWGNEPHRFARFCWDLGSVSVELVDQQLLAQGDAYRGSMDPYLATVENELKVDPWNGWEWATKIGWEGKAGASEQVQSTLQRASALLPESESIPLAAIEQAHTRANIQQAIRLAEEADRRLKSTFRLLDKRLELAVLGDRLGEAARLVQEVKQRRSDPIPIAVAAVKVAERMLDLGAIDQARPLVTLARATEQWQGSVLALTGRFAILEGNTEEGIEWFEKLEQRYPSGGRTTFQLVTALAEAGELELAAKVAQAMPAAVLSEGPVISELAHVFMAFGDVARGTSYFNHLKSTHPDQYGSSATYLVADAGKMGHPRTSKSVLQLLEWVRRSKEKENTTIADDLNFNPNPEAIEALLDGTTFRPMARRYARCLALRGLLDLDMDAEPSEAQIAKVRAQLLAWWSRSKSTYAASRFH
ncbi:MAG: tetratricopeptide repeat protein [Candidatus Wallbacteria bacterium]|nr:tetratricopeptide repeat protein [Candidatus Wallbacteria bacterium]